MKTKSEKNERRTGFTIVELLTVMSIIVILISLLVPSLNKVKRYAKKVKQKAQFHSIDVAMELYATEFDGYPDSGAQDEVPVNYCGALKLAEAMMGQDLLGFHPDSHFRQDLSTDGTTYLYGTTTTGLEPIPPDNLKSRLGPYLQLENANAFRLKDMYADFATFSDGELFVLCDVYSKTKNRTTGKKIGMPLLYYKANLSGMRHDPANYGTNTDPKNIYHHEDNDDLVQLGIPWAAGGLAHPMASTGTTPDGVAATPRIFYEKTKNDKITITDGRPFNSDSYILISAGFDGEYGTADDVFNFAD